MGVLFDRNKTAMLVMDYQTTIVGMLPDGGTALLKCAATALGAARSAGLKIIYVVKDACADLDPTVHACLMEKVFPRQSEILDVDTFVSDMNS